jgi:hypothetical protein
MAAIRALALTLMVLPQVSGATEPISHARLAVADAIWNYHMTVIREAMASTLSKTPKAIPPEFAESIEAIEALTGIASDTGTFVGRLPMPQLRVTIQLWEKWYAKNRDRIQVDLTGRCTLSLRR